MKKLIIAAIAIVATVAVNAATVSWKTSATGKIYEAGTSTLVASATAYLFDVSAYDQGKVVADFANGVDFSAKALGSASVNAGVIASQSFETAIVGDTSLYLAVVLDDNIFISADMSKTIPAVGEMQYAFNAKSASQAAFVGQAADGYSAAGWYQSVPEPTSGLLMLLGMAGLALRRRRA